MNLVNKIEKSLKRLKSTNIESRLHAVEELATCSSEIAQKVAQTYARYPESRFLISQRFELFGNEIVPHLRDVYEEAEDFSLKFHSATALLRLGDNTGIPTLITALREKQEYLCQAATALADSGVEEAVNDIESMLLTCDLSDERNLLCLTSCLRKLGRENTPTVREHLMKVRPRWLREALLNDTGI